WRASGNGRSPSGGETAQYRGHCGTHIGSLSAAGGGEEGPGVRHPALHVLTGGFGRPASPRQPRARRKQNSTPHLPCSRKVSELWKQFAPRLRSYDREHRGISLVEQ